MGAASDALRTHDALMAANGLEPTLDSEGMPLDPDAWVAWHTHVYKPAHSAWVTAMDVLDTELGEHVSRHPRNFRPLCEGLVTPMGKGK